MSRRLKFHSQSQLTAAFGRVLDQGWVDSCTVDVPALELHVRISDGERERRHAEAWIARERRQRRRRSPARD
ncbi:MAG TPA: hypothetical protein VKB65_11810 [Myxococcota bacterium]|nr:hypothetical protein [Myxococcota bacterium]